MATVRRACRTSRCVCHSQRDRHRRHRDRIDRRRVSFGLAPQHSSSSCVRRGHHRYRRVHLGHALASDGIAGQPRRARFGRGSDPRTLRRCSHLAGERHPFTCAFVLASGPSDRHRGCHCGANDRTRLHNPRARTPIPHVADPPRLGVCLCATSGHWAGRPASTGTHRVHQHRDGVVHGCCHALAPGLTDAPRGRAARSGAASRSRGGGDAIAPIGSTTTSVRRFVNCDFGSPVRRSPLRCCRTI